MRQMSFWRNFFKISFFFFWVVSILYRQVSTLTTTLWSELEKSKTVHTWPLNIRAISRRWWMRTFSTSYGLFIYLFFFVCLFLKSECAAMLCAWVCAWVRACTRAWVRACVLEWVCVRARACVREWVCVRPCVRACAYVRVCACDCVHRREANFVLAF